VHHLQRTLLLLWRHAVEVLQALLQLLLPLRRKILEVRIVFQLLLLFGRWQIAVSAQPISDMHCRTSRSCSVVLLSIPLRVVPLLIVVLLLLLLLPEVVTALCFLFLARGRRIIATMLGEHRQADR